VTVRAAHRLAQAAGSGVLIVESGKCLGVRAGECSYPFRIAPSVDISEPPSVEVFDIHTVHNSDLLALSVLLGHEGQASVTCQLGRLNAAAYKKIAADPTILEPMRTFETEDEDRLVSEACGGKPVNAVREKHLLNVKSFDDILVEPLHTCLLGPVNDEHSAMLQVFSLVVLILNVNVIHYHLI
jgi:hypothetical protein